MHTVSLTDKRAHIHTWARAHTHTHTVTPHTHTHTHTHVHVQTWFTFDAFSHPYNTNAHIRIHISSRMFANTARTKTRAHAYAYPPPQCLRKVTTPGTLQHTCTCTLLHTHMRTHNHIQAPVSKSAHARGLRSIFFASSCSPQKMPLISPKSRPEAPFRPLNEGHADLPRASGS